MTVSGATVAVTTSIAGIAGNAGAFKRAVSSVRQTALVLLLGAAGRGTECEARGASRRTGGANGCRWKIGSA